MNHIHDRNHTLVDRIGGSPRRVRVTETAERPVLPFPLPLSGHRARGPELRSGATTGVFSSRAPDPCAIGLPPLSELSLISYYRLSYISSLLYLLSFVLRVG